MWNKEGGKSQHSFKEKDGCATHLGVGHQGCLCSSILQASILADHDRVCPIIAIATSRVAYLPKLSAKDSPLVLQCSILRASPVALKLLVELGRCKAGRIAEIKTKLLIETLDVCDG